MKQLNIVFILMLFCAGQLYSMGTKEVKMNALIKSLMGRMTLQEKIGQLNLITPGGGIPTGEAVSTDVEAKIKAGKVGGIFGVYGPEKVRKAQDLAVKQSRLGIPMLFGSDIIHGYKTTFPIPLGLSCSWDMELVEKVARIAATEATADGICWNFSPMVDIARDPRWGRIAEGGGEDPFLGSQIARAMVKGYQGSDLAAPNTMMATVKHFALYGAAEAGRDYNTVDMSHQRMFNEYFPPYQAAIEAGAGCVMSSFNDVDGVPSSGNKWLLNDVLRSRWNFNGFVVSDYTSVNEMITHGLGDLKTVSALSLKAGLDMDMVGEGFITTLEVSLKEGKVTEHEIDLACYRILRAKFLLGLFDDPYRYISEARSTKEILTVENRKTAREAARRSFVLLKNNNRVLPLKKSGTIALVGPLADSKYNMLGTWAPTGNPALSIPVIEGFRNVVGNKIDLLYAKGSNIIDDTLSAKKINVFGKRVEIDMRSPEEMIQEALTISRKADVIVAVVGEASEMSGESSSRSNISLPESQKKLLRALARTGKPLVLIMMSGRPLELVEENDLADAIIQTWHPGIEAGNAIADVVFGDYNPSGKLSVTFPRNVGQIPIYYRISNTGRPQIGDAFQKFKSNYLDVENTPLFPFGYGLSYTHFEYANLKLSKETLSQNDTLHVSVEVKNIGNLDGEEVVQLYTHDVVASVTRPLKELKGFRKVFIAKGETKKINFEITEKDLRFYNGNLDFNSESGDFQFFIGGNAREGVSGNFCLLK